MSLREDYFARVIPLLGEGLSAKKVAGRRAYRLARAGRPPELRPVPVVVHSFRLGAREGADTVRFHARVGSGTYLRALAEELGRRLELDTSPS